MLPFYLYSGNDLIEPPQVDLRTITLGVPPQEVSHVYMTHSQMLGKVESGGGPIFKVVLEC